MLFLFDCGFYIIDIFNFFELDVMGVIKREFSFYEDELFFCFYEVVFLLVVSNVIDNWMGCFFDGLYIFVSVEKRRINFWCYISFIWESDRRVLIIWYYYNVFLKGYYGGV